MTSIACLKKEIEALKADNKNVREELKEAYQENTRLHEKLKLTIDAARMLLNDENTDLHEKLRLATDEARIFMKENTELKRQVNQMVGGDYH